MNFTIWHQNCFILLPNINVMSNKYSSLSGWMTFIFILGFICIGAGILFLLSKIAGVNEITIFEIVFPIASGFSLIVTSKFGDLFIDIGNNINKIANNSKE